MPRRPNLDPRIWGEHGWFTLDSAALGYPEHATPEEQKGMLNLLTSMPTWLPCCSCRDGTAEYIRAHPPAAAVGERCKVITWLIGLHNNVRAKQGKKPMTEDDFYNYYSKQYSKGPSTITIILAFVVMVLVVIIAVMYSRSRLVHVPV